MELNKFVERFAGVFEDTDRSAFAPETVYKNIAEWSSLTALGVIAMVDEEYDVGLKGADFRDTDTIEELFEVINRQK